MTAAETSYDVDGRQKSARPRYFTKAAANVDYEVMVTDWSINHAARSVRSFLIEIKGLSQRQYEHCIDMHPVSGWEHRRREIVDDINMQLLGHHAASVKQLNEQHLAAANLGLVKALKFLESVTEPKDLKVVVETIAVCQRVSRVALGLPMTDEGIVQFRAAGLASTDHANGKDHPQNKREFTFEELDKMIGRNGKRTEEGES